MVTEDKPKQPTDLGAELQALVVKAKAGEPGVLPRLRELLDEYPDLARSYGNLARQAEATWVALAAGNNLYLKESLVRSAEAQRAELTRPEAQPLEKMLVERVVACSLQVNYFSATEASSLMAGDSYRQLEFHSKRVERAQRMYMAALGALVTYQKLAPQLDAGVTVREQAAIETRQEQPEAVPVTTQTERVATQAVTESVEMNSEEPERLRIQAVGS